MCIKDILKNQVVKIQNIGKSDELLLFKSSKFGDDVDRPLKKSDGTLTYFASDIANHYDKLKRTDGLLVNILGVDHIGYGYRIDAAVSALTDKKDMVHNQYCQLVNMSKNGIPIKMSKRDGNFVTLKSVIDEIGSDAIRIMMLTRHTGSSFQFDFEQVLEKNT